MKIFITGGTGFVGHNLSQHLLINAHHVTATGRSEKQDRIDHPNFTYISADTTKPGKWQSHAEDSDIAVNLAGKSIFTRWTPKTKKQIYDSRILTTRNLVEALPSQSTLLSTSAVGYYGHRGDDIISEDAPAGSDFLAKVSIDWEKEAMEAEKKGVRVAITRFGIILGKDGGAMEKMVPAFKAFVGGPIGDGKQWFPWIHIEDIIHAAFFIMENSQMKGIFNFTAPHPVTNKYFAKSLAQFLNRPAFMPAPAFLVRLFAGEFGQTLLNSQRAIPEKLIKSGYQFKYPDLSDALKDLLD